jgi:hypothetical protein
MATTPTMNTGISLADLDRTTAERTQIAAECQRLGTYCSAAARDA